MAHFDAIGGVPLLAVIDRPKTVALAWNESDEVTKWNATFTDGLVELGVGVAVCWPGRGNPKGSVEKLVGWVEGSFFEQRRSLDDEDLHTQLGKRHTEVNEERPSRATGMIPAR